METLNERPLGIAKVVLAKINAGIKRSGNVSPLAKVNFVESKAEVESMIVLLEAAINEEN